VRYGSKVQEEAKKYARKVWENKQRQFAPVSTVVTNVPGGW